MSADMYETPCIINEASGAPGQWAGRSVYAVYAADGPTSDRWFERLTERIRTNPPRSAGFPLTLVQGISNDGPNRGHVIALFTDAHHFERMVRWIGANASFLREEAKVVETALPQEGIHSQGVFHGTLLRVRLERGSKVGKSLRHLNVI